jgi:hypothetical protein
MNHQCKVCGRVQIGATEAAVNPSGPLHVIQAMSAPGRLEERTLKA